MSREALEQLMARWREDPEFREALRRDLDGTVQRAGYQLDETEWATLRDTDWSRPDEELQSRMTDVVG
jgi:hypothetical protein